MFIPTDKVKGVPAKFFQKEIKNPFMGNDIMVYADLQSASFFHNGFLIPILDGIKKIRNDDISNEDNNIEVFLRCVSPTSFRITFRLNNEDKVRALTMMTKDDDYIIYDDPLV